MSAYVLLVSHGRFAEGLHDTLGMFAGNCGGVMSIGLREGRVSGTIQTASAGAAWLAWHIG